nr:MAG TPA: hypothetical protein [Caudoviricetes sp.]
MISIIHLQVHKITQIRGKIFTNTQIRAII